MWSIGNTKTLSVGVTKPYIAVCEIRNRRLCTSVARCALCFACCALRAAFCVSRVARGAWLVARGSCSVKYETVKPKQCTSIKEIVGILFRGQ